MLDLHSHYLPAIDDGAKNIDDSLEMLRIAAADGISTVVVTPHAFIDSYRENTCERIQSNYEIFLTRLKERMAQAQEPPARLPEVLLGSENFVNERFVLDLEKGRPLLTLNKTSYILLEFPLFGSFNHFDRLMAGLFARGLTAIFAHPERNGQFQSDPGVLHRLTQQGVCLQLDSMSLLGEFGQEAKTLAFYLLKNALAHLIASDAHGAHRRSPILSGAHTRVEKTLGKEKARILFEENPQRIIQGQEVVTLAGGTKEVSGRRSWLAGLFHRS